MGRVKAHYHNHLTMLGQAQPIQMPNYPERNMTDQEYEEFLDYLYAEYVEKEKAAYKFEDNYEPFETLPVPKHLQAKPKGE